MRVAIFSDVHGNLHALDAVLADIAKAKFDAVYCLGDLVGYGAFPNEVTERVHRSETPTVMGNYDDGVGFDRDECGCAYRDPIDQELGDRSLRWTKAHVTSENKAYLRNFNDPPQPSASTTLHFSRTRLVASLDRPRACAGWAS